MAFDIMVPLRDVLAELNHDNDVRVVVLTGSGRGFSSGADHKSAGSVPHVDGLTRPTYALRHIKGHSAKADQAAKQIEETLIWMMDKARNGEI